LLQDQYLSVRFRTSARAVYFQWLREQSCVIGTSGATQDVISVFIINNVLNTENQKY